MPAMRYIMALLLVLSLAGGCARRPAPPPEPPPVIAEVPPAEVPEEAREEAAPAPTAPTPAPEAPPAASEEPRPRPAPPAPPDSPEPPAEAPEKPRGEKLPWRVPEGPLDDAKFIVISAKYIASAVKLAEKGEGDQDTMMEVLRAILKEGRVTVEEYTGYAAQVQDDPERARKVGEAIIRLAEERTGIKLTDEAAAALSGLQPKAIVERE